jgi:hypothetical protein
MSDVLKQVANIAAGAAHEAEEAIPMVATVAAAAHANTVDHESRLSKIESLIAQWAPLIEATAATVEKAVEPAKKS